MILSGLWAAAAFHVLESQMSSCPAQYVASHARYMYKVRVQAAVANGASLPSDICIDTQALLCSGIQKAVGDLMADRNKKCTTYGAS